MRLQRLLASVLLAALGAHAQAAAPRFVAGAYKHLAMWSDDSHAITAAQGGAPTRYIVDGKRAFGPGVLSWAFASGECGDERWGADSGAEVAAANVAAFDRAGVDYIISTGGSGASFTCASDAGMERFIARYDSPRLVGIDFDIEAGQTAAQIDSLVLRAKRAKRKHQNLRFSFTVATFAASDGSMRSLNRTGEAVLAAVRRNRLHDAVFNLMVMDYGAAERAGCVLRGGLCDMGRSAIQAARNVNARYKIPLSQIELTAMIGMNDVLANVFTIDDARVVADAVARMKLAGLHFWSLDRDTPCAAPAAGASPTCSGVDAASGAFGRVLGGAID